MSEELVKITDPDAIAALPVEQRGQLITSALEESKGWLAVATKGTDPTPIAEFKAWAATVAEMTRQKGLAEDIQLDALEMVRRAERGIGVAIRNGQQTGEVRRHRENGGRTEHRARRAEHLAPQVNKVSPKDFLTTGKQTVETYAMTDGITDEQFDEALDEARAEKNLARANVVRKVQGIANGAMTTGEKVAKLRELAAAGHTSKQIAPHLGITHHRVRKIARDHLIIIAGDQATNRAHQINPVRIVQETVNTLQGVEHGLGLLRPDDYDRFTPDQIYNWLDGLAEPSRALRALVKELKAHVQ